MKHVAGQGSLQGRIVCIEPVGQSDPTIGSVEAEDHVEALEGAGTGNVKEDVSVAACVGCVGRGAEGPA